MQSSVLNEGNEKRKGPNKGERVVCPHSGDHLESTNEEGQLKEEQKNIS